MTALCDGNGSRLRLPDSLRVAQCHQCRRWSSGQKVLAVHKDLVRDLVKRGRMGRLAQVPAGQRPICTECRRILAKLEVFA